MYKSHTQMVFDGMLNKKIASVVLEKSKDILTFNFDDNTLQAFTVEGDCCSSSWVEHLDMPNDVEGATLLSIEELGTEEVKDPEHECLLVYQVHFNTDRGTIALEFRNSSNGYYCGWLQPIDKKIKNN